MSAAFPCEPHELPALRAVERATSRAAGTRRPFNNDQNRPSFSEGTVKPDVGGEVLAGEVQPRVQEGSMTAVSQCMHHVGKTFLVRTTESLSSAALLQEGQNESPASYQEVDQRPAGGNELNEVVNRTTKVQKVSISQKRLQTVVTAALVNARTSLPRPGDSSSSCLLGIKRKGQPLSMAPPAEKLKRGTMLSTQVMNQVMNQHPAPASSLSNVRYNQNGNFMGDAATAIVDDAVSAVLENGIVGDGEVVCDATSKASDSE